MSPDSYRYAGVDLQAADDLKDRIGAFASITHGKEVLSGVGAFAGLYRLKDYKEPVLVASTDGVGTKLKVAALLSHYESLGIDLVNLNVNDVITARAKPLFFLDYISIGKLDPQVIEPLLRGMAWACREVDSAYRQILRLAGATDAPAATAEPGEGHRGHPVDHPPADDTESSDHADTTR